MKLAEKVLGLGGRIRDVRIDRNLSQGGLAAMCPPYTRAGKTTVRSSTWLSNIENGKYEPSIGDLVAIADALCVTTGYLLTGEDSGDTEFVARIRGMERHLDERGRRAVIATAEREAEEYRRSAQGDTFAELERQMIASGLSPEQAAEITQRAQAEMAGGQEEASA